MGQKRFPRTMQLIAESGIQASGLMFSRLPSGKWLNPHLGPTKQVLRYHLVLKAAANISSQYLEIWNCSNIPQVWKDVLQVRQGAAQRMWSSPQGWFEPELKEVFEENCKPERLSWEEGSDMYFDDTF